MNAITYEQREKVYCEAITLYGAEAQAIVAIEELSELTKEICKAMRGKLRLDALCEEIADATIMLEQLRILFDVNDMVCEQMDAKVLRLEEALRKERAKTAGRVKDVSIP